MKTKLIGLVILAVGSLASFSLQEPVPRGRAPLIPRITSVDQLVPFAKIIVQRDYIGQRLGWSIRGGTGSLLFGYQGSSLGA